MLLRKTGLAFCCAVALTANGVHADDNKSYEPDKESSQPSITHGVSIGDVTHSSAVVWSRADGEGFMHVAVNGPGVKVHKKIKVSAFDDFTGKVLLKKLKPGSKHHYKVWFSKKAKQDHVRRSVISGSFSTAPAPQVKKPLTLAWGGDLAGQNVCRDASEGFPVFDAINALQPDLFIGLGDMIYADGVCETTGRYQNQQMAGDFTQSSDLANYWAHWKYNREDAGYRQLLASTPYFAIWDDHEVVNDFGPLHDTRTAVPYTPGEHLLPLGLKAFLDYNPVMEHSLTPNRLYRKFRWGKNLEMFVLDNRQYRDANSEADDESLTKTMLGREQLTWLKESLQGSDSTWKFIVTSVPLSIPTGFPAENGRDGWANFDQNTGFEHELVDLLKFMRDEKIHNVIFITTDVHFAEVFRYTPFSDSPEFQVHEYVVGPLNAGLFPNRNFDTSLGTESLFFYGPESFSAVSDYRDARQWMNFGTANIDEYGMLTMSVRDVDGEVKYEAMYQPK